MEQYGNTTTFNIENILVQNIKNSLYYVKSAMDLDHTHELIDEIYMKVEDVEPWMSGNARGPSTAFCLLYRLGQIKPSASEIREMLDHQDSPYIRAIGFLYLRYTCNPREIWSWFKKYMQDTEEITPSPSSVLDSKTITIGQYARDILLDQFYFETIFPRIPKLVLDEIKDDLRKMGLPTEAIGNGGQGGGNRRGDDSGRRRITSVKQSLAVGFGQRAPNRAGAVEEGRGFKSDSQLRKNDGDNDRRRGGDYGGNSSSRRRSRSPDYYGYDRRRDYDNDRRRDRDYNSSSRRRSRSPEYRRREYRDDDRRYDRRDYHNDRSPRRDYHNDRRSDHHRYDDDNNRNNTNSRDVSDVFRERPAPAMNGRQHQSYKDLY